MQHPGLQIRSLRQARGLSQRELAQRTHIPVSTISDIERGRYRTIAPRHAAAVARALDVPVEMIASKPPVTLTQPSVLDGPPWWSWSEQPLPPELASVPAIGQLALAVVAYRQAHGDRAPTTIALHPSTARELASGIPSLRIVRHGHVPRATWWLRGDADPGDGIGVPCPRARARALLARWATVATAMPALSWPLAYALAADPGETITVVLATPLLASLFDEIVRHGSLQDGGGCHDRDRDPR